MRSVLGASLLAVICCVLGLAGSPAVAFGDGFGTAPGGEPAGAAGWLQEGLVVPGVQRLDGGEQVQAALVAQRLSPEAVAARRVSQTAYEGLGPRAAAALAREAFPVAVGEPADGSPVLSAGERIVGYPSDMVAQVALPGGGRGVVESTQPIDVGVSGGRRAPVDLALSRVGGAFRPVRALVGVRIPRRVSEGVALLGSGVSLTPVGAGGGSLGGAEGVIDGSAVFYGGTGADMDTAVKPTGWGFEVDALLRSARSPSQLHLHVGLPRGARLVPARDGSGAFEVVGRAGVLATVTPPLAQDAAGVRVPVSMRASGENLVLSVADRGGEYRYPIEVDPEAREIPDSQLLVGKEEFGRTKNSNWKSGGYFNWREGEGLLYDSCSMCGGYERGDTGAVTYETQGVSRIVKFQSVTSSSEEENNIVNELMIVGANGEQLVEELPDNYGPEPRTLCTPGCAGGFEHNAAVFQQRAVGREGWRYGGSFRVTMSSATVWIVQNQPPSLALSWEGRWLKRGDRIEAKVTDPGLGISEIRYRSPDNANWQETLVDMPNYSPFECSGVQCPEHYSIAPEVGGLPDGEDLVEFAASDPAGLKGEATSSSIKIDNTPPEPVGIAGLPTNHEIGNAEYHLTASTKDGAGETMSSGVASISLKIDGKPLGTPRGMCSPGPCVASGEWVISGSEFAVGPHTLTATATDNAGNVSNPVTVTIYVARPTTPVGVGPGSVDPQSGELLLASTDVSVTSPVAPLTVSRSFASLHVAAGEGGPLGPQWTLNTGGGESISKLPDGDLLLGGGSQMQAVFAATGQGAFAAPRGDQNLTLSEVPANGEGKEFMLADGSGRVTRFTPSGTPGSWLATTRELPGVAGVTKISYQTVAGVTEPTQILAPVAAGIKSCAGALERGCRALTFNYATETKRGESEGEWSDYTGRLKSISFTAWDPSKGKMTETTVAQYSYDGQGRLHAEWDPRVPPALKTTYGYDTEGHITALSAPGQQPWLFTYGAIAGDSRDGRLLAVTRPGAQTPPGSQGAPAIKTAPGLSTGTPVEGAPVSTGDGSWSNAPLSYSYQWEDCSEYGYCTPILGASNQSYLPVPSDRGSGLRVTVTASNASGSSTASSSVTSAVPTIGYYEHAREFGGQGSGNGQLSKPAGITVDPSGHVWVADTANSRIEEFSSSGVFIKAIGKLGSGEGEFKEPKGIAVNKEGSIFVADSGNSRIEELSVSGAYEAQIATSSPPSGLALSTHHVQPGNGWIDDIYLTLPARNEIAVYTEPEEGEYERYPLSEVARFGGPGSGNGQFNDPTGVATGASGTRVYVTDTGNHRVQVLRAPEEYSEREHLEYVGQFGSAGSGVGQFATPTAVAVAPETLREGPSVEAFDGDAIVADPGNARLQLFSSGDAFQRQYSEEGGQALAVSSTTAKLYVANSATSKISEWVPAPVPASPLEPPKPGASAVTTIEYHVPLSGAGAPYPMSSGEVGRWAQSDLPAEATAFFPPDEPQAWPASDYRRASVYYLDALGHTVNVASPGGGISTAEYNQTNAVVRTLSADNRAAALKQGNHSAETSILLDTENTYNSEGSEPGSELLSTLGPQHNVRLAQSGQQVQARTHTLYSYNEGAPSEGGPYRLVTKMTQAAQYEGKEAERRETQTSYAGQQNLGWKLHKPTAVTTGSGAAKTTHTTLYEPATADPIETQAPAATNTPPASITGYEGAEVSLRAPGAVAVDPSGHVWVTDTGNHRVVEFNAERKYLRQVGEAGSGQGQFQSIGGIATNASGDLYVTDTTGNRVQEFGPSGEYLRSFSQNLLEPAGVTVDAEGNVWVLNTQSYSYTGRIVEFSATGTYLGRIVSSGSAEGQLGLAYGLVCAGGHLYVADHSNQRVQEFSTSGAFVRQFDEKGSGNGKSNYPYNIAADPGNGDVYVSETGSNRVQEFTPSGSFITAFASAGSGPGQLSNPEGLAIAPSHKVYIADTNNSRIQEWATEPPSYTASITGYGGGEVSLRAPGAVAVDPSGNVWVADTGNHRVVEFSPERKYLRQVGEAGSGQGQFQRIAGVATNASGDLYVTDTTGNRVQEFGPSGEYLRSFSQNLLEPAGVTVDPEGNVWVLNTQSYSYTGRIVEFSATGTYLGKVVSSGSAEGQLGLAYGLVFAGGHLYVADHSNQRVQEFATNGAFVRQFDEKGSGNGKSSYPYGIAADPATGDLYVSETGNNRVQEFTPSGSFITAFASAGSGPGQLSNPQGLAIATASTVYVADTTNNRLAIESPPAKAHDTQTIYYTAKTEASVAICQNHPEWAGLVCQAQPAAQPQDGLGLPVTTLTYNIWDEPQTTTQAVANVTRATTNAYDPAGRLITSATTRSESSPLEVPLPQVTYAYSPQTGALISESTGSGAEEKRITSTYNSLGELTTYTDADENTSTYTYDEDGRVKTAYDGKGTQTYTYSGPSGLLTELADSSAANMKFTAAYDTEGNMTSEGYPNGMSANYTYDTTGKPVSLQYKKTSNCNENTENCVMFSDTIVPSINGQWLTQQSTRATQTYTYDPQGRLQQVQNTPTGKGCATRTYAYDEEGNRTSLTTRPPGREGKCASEGGSTETHTYDEANRLTDAGTTYSTFGDITALPATDAGGSALTNSYYLDGQLHDQTQNGQSLAYNLDPAGRTRETIETGAKAQTTISHYAGPETSPAWSINSSSEWTRNIPGIGGTLAATQTNGETPVLQIMDLHDDIIATASPSETSKTLEYIEEPTEFGVPGTSTPPKHSWLGAIQLPTELPAGIIAMGARSYIPQLGRFLQPDPIPGGSANAYTYTYGDPINSSDPTGQLTSGLSAWLQAALTQGTAAHVAAEATREREAAENAARETAAREAALQAAAEATANAQSASGPQYTGENEEEWGNEEEEGEYEYATYRPNPDAEREASFGPGLAIAVVDNGENRREAAAVRSPLELGDGGRNEAVPPSAESGNSEAQGAAVAVALCVSGQHGSCRAVDGRDERAREPLSPSGGCGTGEASATYGDVTELGRREYVHGKACPKLPRKDYHRGAERRHSHWWEPYAKACLVGGSIGAASTGQPEAGCAAGVAGVALEKTADWLASHT